MPSRCFCNENNGYCHCEASNAFCESDPAFLVSLMTTGYQVLFYSSILDTVLANHSKQSLELFHPNLLLAFGSGHGDLVRHFVSVHTGVSRTCSILA
ncbi:hypothetical protein L596_018097 [Steinernema carpocapsae]|uniref:EGF-like domain-containing protein n=1 Tax=Steinernema carpocapsae TaxID=34508 RepID=A0A4U5N3M4_STECR|nr:hypothetical protein L596_018097 [Steinernema carpocapsae]